MKVTNVKHEDITEINRLLKSSPLVTTSIIKGLIGNLDNPAGVSVKMVDDSGKLLGVWFSLEFTDYISLSHFYVIEEVRCSKKALVFFKICYDLVPKDKPLLLKANDTSLFKKRVVHVESDVYMFTGGISV